MVGEVKVWDLTRRCLVASLTPHKLFVLGLCFSQDGQWLASGGSDQFIDIWSAGEHSSWTKAAELHGHAHQIWDMTFTPDGQLVSASRDGSIKFWNVRPEPAQQALGGQSMLGFTRDSQAVTLDTDSTVRVWDAATLQEITHQQLCPGTRVTAGAFSPRTGSVAIGKADARIDLRTLIGDCQRTLGPCQAPAFALRFSPDGRTLAAAYADAGYCSQGKLDIWDTQTGTRSAVGDGFGRISGFDFSHSGRLLAVGDANDTAWLWDLSENRRIHRLLGHHWTVTGVAFSPDDRLLATASADATTRLWDTATGKEIGRLRGQTITIVGACFSPDGRTLATVGMDRTLVLWHVPSRQELLTLQLNGNFFKDPFFSPDGNALAIGTYLFMNTAGYAQIWRAPSLRQIERVTGMGIGQVQRR